MKPVTGAPPQATVPVAPGLLPVLGHGLSFARQPLRFLSGLPACGDVTEVRFGSRKILVVCHPDLMHQVLRDGSLFDKGGPLFEQARPVLGNGVVTCPHAEHRRQRRLVQPAFTADRLGGYAAVVGTQVEQALRSWQTGQVIDVVTAMNAITAATTAQILFAANLASEELADLQQCLTVVSQGVFRRMLTPAVLRRVPTPGNRRFDRAIARLDQLVARIITAYRHDETDHGDMLSMLVSARDERGDALADREIRDQIISFILAGTETTATALAWALYLLALHPEVEQRLHNEVDTVLSGEVATYADLPNLGYARQILDETLRLHPPIWLMTREVTRNTQLAGATVSAGATVLISPYLVHHRPDLFPDPDRFDPDRWRPDHPTPPRGAYIPFGGGARKCIGDALALTEATLMLATLARRWRLTAMPGAETRPLPRATLRPHPLRLQAVSRFQDS